MIRAFLLLIALGSAVASGWIYINQPPRPPAVAVAVADVDPTPQPAAPSIELVSVLAARGDLQFGQTVGAADLVWMDWPADRVLSHQILQTVTPDGLERLNGQVAMLPAAAGEPVRADGFAPPAARPISERLAPGMRAVAVRVNLEAAVGGFVLPNDRVDVIHTDISRADGVAHSTVAVFNARVIAIDQTTQQGSDETILVLRTVTLELDRAGAEAVASAQTTGQLTLALRATADMNEPSTVPPSISQSLASGMRAVVLSEVELSAGGAIRPGDRIDLIHRLRREESGQQINTIIASNVRVIAIDAFANGVSGGSASSVVLELDSDGVAALSAALGAGVLSLSLRSAADMDEQPQVQFPSVPAPVIGDPEVRIRRGDNL